MFPRFGAEEAGNLEEPMCGRGVEGTLLSLIKESENEQNNKIGNFETITTLFQPKNTEKV